jgi:hypothetical protein
MRAKFTPINRLDQLDAERFRDMIESPPFQLLISRVQAELERACETCVTGNDELAIRRAQGAAAQLRTVLRLPAQVLEEIKGNRQKPE